MKQFFKNIHIIIKTCRTYHIYFITELRWQINLIQLMEEIIKALNDDTSKIYTQGINIATGTQMAGHLLQARNKAEDLKNKAIILTTFQPEGEGKQLKHLKCPQNHWLQFQKINTFTCSRQGCGTIYDNQNQARFCKQCNFYACENCIHHQQV
ncbi:hypothetical protein pb186bvf_013930 [Paramecium bursaria]